MKDYSFYKRARQLTNIAFTFHWYSNKEVKYDWIMIWM